MEEIALVARAMLAGVLAAAAAAKLLDLPSSRAAPRALGVPAPLAPVAAVLIPAVEATAAGLLLIPATAMVGAVVASALLVAFTLVLGANLARGNRPPCNCFGQTNEAPISPRSVARNLALLAAAVVAMGGVGSRPAVAVPALGAGLLAQSILVYPLLRDRRPSEYQHAGTSAGPAIGAIAPEFDLADLEGDRHTLADLRADGRAVLLVFVDPHCGPCEAIAPEIADWRRTFADRLNVVVVSAGEIGAMRGKAREAELDLVLVQPGDAVAESFGYEGTPGAVLVDADGRIASRRASGAPDIRRLVADVTARLNPVWTATGAPTTKWPVRAVGDPAPYVELPAPDGSRVSLGLMAGKVALVVLWDPDCGFCAAMADEWRAWQKDRPDSLGVLVLSDGDADTVAAQDLGPHVGLDPGGLTRRAFGADGTPMAVLVDASGRIASPIAAGRDEVLALAGRAAHLARLADTFPTAASR